MPKTAFPSGTQHFGVYALVKTDDQGLSHLQGRRTQVAAGTDDAPGEYIVSGIILLHIVIDKLLSPSHQNTIRRPGDRNRLFRTDA